VRADFELETFILRAVESGMVSMGEVKRGDVTIVDIQKIVAYLDMRADVEWANRKHNDDW